MSFAGIEIDGAVATTDAAKGIEETTTGTLADDAETRVALTCRAFRESSNIQREKINLFRDCCQASCSLCGIELGQLGLDKCFNVLCGLVKHSLSWLLERADETRNQLALAKLRNVNFNLFLLISSASVRQKCIKNGSSNLFFSLLKKFFFISQNNNQTLGRSRGSALLNCATFCRKTTLAPVL